MTWPTATTTCEEIDAVALWILFDDGPNANGMPYPRELQWTYIDDDGQAYTRIEWAAKQWVESSAAVRAGWRTAMPLDDFAREALRPHG